MSAVLQDKKAEITEEAVDCELNELGFLVVEGSIGTWSLSFKQAF